MQAHSRDASPARGGGGGRRGPRRCPGATPSRPGAPEKAGSRPPPRSLGPQTRRYRGGRPRLLVPGARGGPTSLESHTDRKSTRLNSSHLVISYAVFCLKKKKI